MLKIYQVKNSKLFLLLFLIMVWVFYVFHPTLLLCTKSKTIHCILFQLIYFLKLGFFNFWPVQIPADGNISDCKTFTTCKYILLNFKFECLFNSYLFDNISKVSQDLLQIPVTVYSCPFQMPWVTHQNLQMVQLVLQINLNVIKA